MVQGRGCLESSLIRPHGPQPAKPALADWTTPKGAPVLASSAPEHPGQGNTTDPFQTQTACGSAAPLPRLHAHGLPTVHIETAPSSGREDGFVKPRVATGRAVNPCPQIPG